MDIGLCYNKTASTPGDETQHKVEAEVTCANVFFDGTGNNYDNVKAELDIKKQHGGAKLGSDGELDSDTSYDSDLTNIARMWKGLGGEKGSSDPLVYVQGIGTTAYKDDSVLGGYAFGYGDTGIEKRVREAFTLLKKDVIKKSKKGGLPAILEINVFGFSRGSAAARLFVYRVNSEKSESFGEEWTPVKVRINFVGLFDTVSSEGAKYSNDVKDLHLSIGAGHAHHVLHLIALDEYRERFSVTTVGKSDDAPKVLQLGIPGAHSDVGGSYLETAKEVRDLSQTALVQTGNQQHIQRGTRGFAYEQGFYTPSNAAPKFWHPDRHERVITSDYYRVALSIMVDAAQRHTTSTYPGSLTDPSSKPEIESLRGRLRKEANKDCSGDWSLERLLEDKEKARAFRHQYLHLSCQEDTAAHSPRFKNDSELEREYVQG